MKSKTLFIILKNDGYIHQRPTPLTKNKVVTFARDFVIFKHDRYGRK